MKKIPIILLLLTFSLSQLSFVQTKNRVYQTLNETSYVKGDLIRMDIVYHDSRLDGSSNEILKTLADFLLAHPNISVEIGSYTDQRGSYEFNKKMSQNRANSVIQYLGSTYKIPAEQMTAVGYGEDDPIHAQGEIDKATGNKIQQEEMYQKNRRTEIKILSVK